MKRILLAIAVGLAVAAFLVTSLGASSGSAAGTYKIELDNAFGLVRGAPFKIAGVVSGKISRIDLDRKTLHALVTIQVTQVGFGQFRTDAFCQTRPQELIGEYFIDCQPGERGKVLPPGSTIPVTSTQSTIPGDLLADIMRLPYRERFTLIINELGAAVAGRSEDLQVALRRAVPALTETDNLLNLLAGDSHTLQSLTVNSDHVVTALANNSSTVQRFISEAGRTATTTATQQGNLRGTLARLPTFLEQLRPSMVQLGAVTDANTPPLQNLSAASGQLNRLLTDLPGFTRSGLPAVRSLGRASVTGREAAVAATPTIRDLNAFSKPTPELAKNLSIVLRDLDSQGRAVEADPRSPGGKGFTGLQALLQFFFNTPMGLNTFGPFGHLLAVDLFVDPQCSPYATPATIAMSLQKYGSNYRHCYSWLGPNQPGVTTRDPSNPTACVPDPGGAPPGERGAPSTACKLTAADVRSARTARAAAPRTARAASSNGTATPTAARAPTGGTARSGRTLGQMLSSGLGGRSGASPSSGQPSGSQTQQLLNYLLAP